MFRQRSGSNRRKWDRCLTGVSGVVALPTARMTEHLLFTRHRSSKFLRYRWQIRTNCCEPPERKDRREWHGRLSIQSYCSDERGGFEQFIDKQLFALLLTVYCSPSLTIFASVWLAECSKQGQRYKTTFSRNNTEQQLTANWCWRKRGDWTLYSFFMQDHCVYKFFQTNTTGSLVFFKQDHCDSVVRFKQDHCDSAVLFKTTATR